MEGAAQCNLKRLAGFKDLAARAADPAQSGEQSNRAYLAGINADEYAQDTPPHTGRA